MVCEQTSALNYFLDSFMISGLGNFLVHCSSVFANSVPKKQTNIRIRIYKRNDLAISNDKSGDVMC